MTAALFYNAIIIFLSSKICGAAIEPLYPSTIQTKLGVHSTHQDVGVLGVKNTLKEDEDDWDTYIELEPKSGRIYKGNVLFDIPQNSKIFGSDWKVNFAIKVKGPAASTQKWIFRIKNFKASRFEILTSNKSALDWQWTDIERAGKKLGTLKDYVNNNGKILVEIRSNNDKDNFNLDFVEIQLTQPGGGVRPLIKPQDTWTYDLPGKQTSYNTDVVMIDMEDTTAQTISRLKSQGKVVSCYFSAGSFESWRSDASSFPDKIKGNKMFGWDEIWIDTQIGRAHV